MVEADPLEDLGTDGLVILKLIQRNRRGRYLPSATGLRQKGKRRDDVNTAMKLSVSYNARKLFVYLTTY